jgi:beta-lactamase regulating signal transducer with metallopeptidase domain
MFSALPDHAVATNADDAGVDERPLVVETTPAFSLSPAIAETASRAKPWLAAIWLLGSALVFAGSMLRVFRFNRLLTAEAEVAPEALQKAAAKLAHRFGLNGTPAICTTSAHLSPMVWWTGGRVRVVVPTTLLDRMDARQTQWILAHELAHVRRRDYLVRWLEWLACVCFWWNPVVWGAQRNLRAMEEICCDELVLSCLDPEPKHYANALLAAVEYLARPVLRPPAVASEVNSGGFLERRFKMIVSERPRRSHSRWLHVSGVVLCALVVLPLGIASAQDYEAVAKRLKKSVKKGEITARQADLMMAALKKGAAKSKGDTDYEAMVKEIRAAVQAGKLTKEEGRAKLAAIRREAARKNQDAERATAYLMKVKKELGELVTAGKISKEDAAKRFKAAEKGIKERMAGQSKGERGQRSITVEEYRRAEAKMRKMVEDGKAKPEDVERRLIEMRKMIGEQGDRGQRSITVEDYRRAEAKMRKMVEEGQAKPEDVERRLIEMRKIIGDQSKRGGERQRTTRGDERTEYEGFERRIKAEVEAGRMTREEAREKLAGFRRRMEMVEQGEQGERRITREDYARAEAEMQKMVEAGEISKEDMRTRLNEMRRMMDDEISDDAAGRRR